MHIWAEPRQWKTRLVAAPRPGSRVLQLLGGVLSGSRIQCFRISEPCAAGFPLRPELEQWHLKLVVVLNPKLQTTGVQVLLLGFTGAASDARFARISVCLLNGLYHVGALIITNTIWGGSLLL